MTKESLKRKLVAMESFRWTSEKFPPANACIYANAGENHDGPLTDEHIIPFGLLSKGGDWFLPKSSCLNCACITKKFEDLCLRRTLGVARATLDLKTRNKKDRNKAQKVIFKRPDGGEYIREMKYRDMPPYCIGFDWPVPGILRGGQPDETDYVGKLIVRSFGDELRNFIPTEGHGVKLGSIRMLDFARMLAKIGHSYACAKFGIGSFDPFLLDLILGRSENAPFLVGGDGSGEVLDQPDVLHDIFPLNCRVGPDGAEYMGVAIRLFAFWRMPRYHVIVGRKL